MGQGAMTTDGEDDEGRLVELETRAAFQEETIWRLQETVTAHERRLYELGRQLEEIRRQLSRSELSPHTAGGEDPPPPHY